MPFDANRFDFAVCVAAFKNFTQPVKALNEFHRVLKPGGKALIVDLRRDASFKDIQHEVNNMKLNAVNSFLTRWTFKTVLLKNAYTQREIESLVAQTNFKRCDVKIDFIGMEILLAK
jgi:ubiquinone/menaquinone biosynthesis C-methylase UbiE